MIEAKITWLHFHELSRIDPDADRKLCVVLEEEAWGLMALGFLLMILLRWADVLCTVDRCSKVHGIVHL